MQELQYNSPEEVQSQLSQNAVLWIVTANSVTGTLSCAVSLPAMYECRDRGLIEQAEQIGRWKLNQQGWHVRRVMLRQ
ncbi:hypothetical protein SAMN02982917_5481 [Azospirillum oryzae]|uniref:Uncharacterized protein n=1 Tax=Azospirillum oryzae TaxID=286727 RepID=A0A1X7HB61_9PROT|nr:hypothetical protein [Azospirillum oryzae]SMF83173.1 hypothetical protein SAMN02982917_5481 [Azospirillum oryzae]